MKNGYYKTISKKPYGNNFGKNTSIDDHIKSLYRVYTFNDMATPLLQLLIYERLLINTWFLHKNWNIISITIGTLNTTIGLCSNIE